MSNKVGSGLSAALCAFLALVLFVLNVPACGGIFLLLALLFGSISFGIWFHQQARDRQIIEAVKTERTNAAKELPAPPPMSSRNSYELKVPRPLDDRQ